MKEISSVVIHGQRIGSRIGFPTANMDIDKDVSVENGVYASITKVGDTEYHSLTNIGLRPTVCGKKRLIETHLLDFSGDLYDKVIIVSLLKKIREEKKFESLDALKTQLEKDASTIRAFFTQKSIER